MNLRQGCIGDREAGSLVVIISSINCAFMLGETGLYRAGNQAWLAAAAGAAVSLCVFIVVAKAMQRRSCATLGELYADAAGKVFAAVLGVLTALLLLSAASLPLVHMLLTFQRNIFVDAETELLAVYVQLALLPLVLLGFEPLGRTAKLLCPVVFMSLLLMLLLGLPDYERYRLYPLLGGGTDPFFLLTGRMVLCFLPPLLLLLIAGRGVHGVRNAVRIGAASTAVSGAFSVLLQLAIGAAFSYRQLRRIDTPVYQLILSVRGGMQMRLDKILLSVWLIGMLLGAAALLYGASLQLCESMLFRDVRPIGAVYSVLCTSLVLLGHRAEAGYEQLEWVLTHGAGAVMLGVVILPSLICFLKKERCLCESVA